MQCNQVLWSLFMLQGALGCSRLAHLKDFEVVLRFFYKLSDCKVHSLFVAEKNPRNKMLTVIWSI